MKLQLNGMIVLLDDLKESLRKGLHRADKMILERRVRRREINKIVQAMEGRVLIEMTYTRVSDGKTASYVLEPYSFRKPNKLYAWDTEDKSIKCFIISNIVSVNVTTRKFRPRWRVEPESIRQVGLRREQEEPPEDERELRSVPTYLVVCI